MDFDETGLKRLEIYSSCALFSVRVSLAVPFSPEREKVGSVEDGVQGAAGRIWEGAITTIYETNAHIFLICCPI